MHCRPLLRRKVWDFTHSISRRTAVCGCCWRTWVGACLRASSSRSWNPWTFVSKDSHSCLPGVATRNPPRTALPLQHISGARTRGVHGAITHRTLRLANVRWVVHASKGTAAMSALPTLRPPAAQLRIGAPVRRLCGHSPHRRMLYPTGTATVLWLRGKLHTELPWLCKVKVHSTICVTTNRFDAPPEGNE